MKKATLDLCLQRKWYENVPWKRVGLADYVLVILFGLLMAAFKEQPVFLVLFVVAGCVQAVCLDMLFRIDRLQTARCRALDEFTDGGATFISPRTGVRAA